MRPQRTIAQPAEYSGIGLHTGAMVHIRLVPAEADTGVVFERTDTAEQSRIPLHVDNVEQKPLCTNITKDGVHVQTVEHLLSALRAFEIDNVVVEINSIEPPGADGSAKEFCNLILNAGVMDLDAPRESFSVTDPVYYSEGDSSIVALPNPKGGFRVSYTLEYDTDLIPRQHVLFELTRDTFISEIAPARTFCFEHEARALKEAGFGKGASTNNTCVIIEGGLLDNELRYRDEFVRHKILDMIGDLSVIGFDIDTHIVAMKTGHAHNFHLANLILQSKNQTLKAPA